MSEYHKIQTLYFRDPATNHKTLLEGVWAAPEFAYLAGNEWLFTEKVDGTNIRVLWDGERVRFAGKTDDAQTHPTLLAHLAEVFTPSALRGAFDCGDVVLYGEGYGAKIQKGGGRYVPDGCRFILFDVMVGGIWLERGNVEDVARNLSIKAVPIVGRGTLLDAVEMVRGRFKSTISADTALDAEGLVMRPSVDLFDRRGHRIITKLKAKDFAFLTSPPPIPERGGRDA